MSIATTERYTAVDDDEVLAAALAAAFDTADCRTSSYPSSTVTDPERTVTI